MAKKEDELDPSLLRKEKKSPEDKSKQPVEYIPVKRKLSFLGKGAEKENIPLWLLTFTDAIALMLTFFVLLYAMSTPKEDEFERMTSAMSKGFGEYLTKEWNSGTQDTISIDKIDSSEALSLKYLRALLEDITKNSENLADVTISLQKDRLVLSLPTSLLFTGGKAEVQREGKRAIFVLGDLLSRIRNKIEVVGHADPRPAPERFQSNWHLSLARAASVAGVLEDVGYSRNITIRGLSDARYSELPEDMAEEERLQLARRVDIVILRSDGRQRQILRLDEF